MDWTQPVDCQNCLVLVKKLELFDLLKQKCCKNDDIAKNLLLLKKTAERTAKLLENKVKKLHEARSRVTELERAEEILKRKSAEYQVKLVAADTRYEDVVKDLDIEHERYSALNQEKLQLLVTLEAKENEIASLTLISKQTEEQHGIDINDLKAKLEKSQDLIKANSKQRKQNAALKKKYDKLVETLLEVFNGDVMDQGEPFKKLKKHVTRLKSINDAAKLEAELNTPSLTPDGTTSSDTGIFSGDEDFGAPSLTDDLQLSSDGSDDEFEEVEQSPDSTCAQPAVSFASLILPNPPSQPCPTFESNDSIPSSSLDLGVSVDTGDNSDETICLDFNGLDLDDTITNPESHAETYGHPTVEPSNAVLPVIAEGTMESSSSPKEKRAQGLSLFDPVDDSPPTSSDLNASVMDLGISSKNVTHKPSDPTFIDESSLYFDKHEATPLEDDDIVNNSAHIAVKNSSDLSSPKKALEENITDIEPFLCEEKSDVGALSHDSDIIVSPVLNTLKQKSNLVCDAQQIQSAESNEDKVLSYSVASSSHSGLTSTSTKPTSDLDPETAKSKESKYSDVAVCTGAVSVQTGDAFLTDLSSNLESFEMSVPCTPTCTYGSKPANSPDKGISEVNILSRTTGLSSLTSSVDHTSNSVAPEKIIQTSDAIDDSRTFEEDVADDLSSEQDLSSAETDVETMLNEWNTPTPILPFSEDSCSFGGENMDSLPTDQMDTLSVPTFSHVTSALSSPGNVETNIQAISRKSPSHSPSSVSVGTNTDPLEYKNTASSPVSSLSNLISSNNENSENTQQEESLHFKGQKKNSFTSPESFSHDRSVSPLRISLRDMGVSPIEEMRSSIALSPMRRKGVDTASSPIQCLIQNRSVSPIKCTRRDVASSPVRSLFKSMASSPLRVNTMNAETSPIKMEFDRGSPDSLGNCNYFNRCTEVWHPPSQESPSRLTWSKEAQMLQGAIETLGINSGDLAGVTIDEALVEELRHAMEVALKKVCLEQSSPPSNLSANVFKKRGFCLFDPCELEELCNQQHYNLHLLAKSKTVEETMCSLGRPKKSFVKRLKNSGLRRKQTHLIQDERSLRKTKSWQNPSDLPINGKDNPILNHDVSFCTMESNAGDLISVSGESSSFQAVSISDNRCAVNIPIAVAQRIPPDISENTNIPTENSDLQKESCKNVQDAEMSCVSSAPKVQDIEGIRKSPRGITEITKKANTPPHDVNPLSPSKLAENTLLVQTDTSSQVSTLSHLLKVLTSENPILSSSESNVLKDKMDKEQRIASSTPRFTRPVLMKGSNAKNNPSSRKVTSSSILPTDSCVDLVIDTSCDDSELDDTEPNTRPENKQDGCDVNESDSLISNNGGNFESSPKSDRSSSDTPKLVQENLLDSLSMKPTGRTRKRVSISSESSSIDGSSPNSGTVSVRRSSRAKKIRIVHDWNSGSKGSYERGYMKFVKGESVFVSKEPDQAASEMQVPASDTGPGLPDSIDAISIDAISTDSIDTPSVGTQLKQSDISAAGSKPSNDSKIQELSESPADDVRQSNSLLSNVKAKTVKRRVESKSSQRSISKRLKKFSSKEIVEDSSDSDIGESSPISSEKIASNVTESSLKCEASLIPSKQKVPSIEEKIASTSSLRPQAPTHKPSKLQKLRSKVSRIHPLTHASKCPKTSDESNETTSNICPAESSMEKDLRLPGTSHFSLDHVKTAQSEADILEKFRGRECLRMAAAASGRTAQLIGPSEEALAKRRAAAELLSLNASGLKSQKRNSTGFKSQPLVCPQDRRNAMENNDLLRSRSAKSLNVLSEGCQPTKERICKLSTQKHAGSNKAVLAVEKTPSSPKKTTVSFLINHNDEPRKTALSPLACIISDQPDRLTPSCTKDFKGTEKLVAETLKAFVAAPLFTPVVLQKAIDALSSPELFNVLPVIVRDVVKMMDEDYDTPMSMSMRRLPSVPDLTPVQQQLVTLVLQLSFQVQHLKPLPQQVLDLLEYRVFRLGKAPEGDRLYWCARLHTAICRALCLRSRALIFCWDSVYTFRGLSYRVVKVVLDVWPSLFPINPSFEKACPNVQVMLHFLRSHVDKQEEDQHTRKFDNSWLKRLLSCAGVQTASLNSSCLASKIFCNLLGGGDETNVSALVLLAKREDEQWAMKDLISGKLLPALEKWRSKSLDDVAGERVIWTTCAVLRQLPVERIRDSASLLIKLLRSELLRSEGDSLSPHMQEVVAIGLALLSRHDIENVAFSLLSWNSGHGSSLGLSSRLLHYLSFLVKSTARPLSWWQTQLSMNSNNHSKANLEE